MSVASSNEAGDKDIGPKRKSDLVPRIVYALISAAAVAIVSWLFRGAEWTIRDANSSGNGGIVISAAIPFAIGVATALVSGLRALDGALTFSVLGVHVRGASAMLIAWIASFGALITAFRVLC